MQSEFNKLCSMYADREYTGHIISLNNVSHSKIRNLEIVGETKEFGEGDKSPDNPYELVSSLPELKIVKENLANPANYFYNSNIKSAEVKDEGISGTSNQYGTYFIGVIFRVQPGKTYYFTYGEYTSSLNTILSPKVYYFTEKPINGKYSDISSKTIRYEIGSGFPMAINIPENCKYAAVGFSSTVDNGYTAGDVITVNNLTVSLNKNQKLYKPYIEQSVKIISKNLYSPFKDNFLQFNKKFSLSENNYITLADAKNESENNLYMYYTYDRIDLFSENTKYTFILEVAEAEYTGNFDLYISAKASEGDIFHEYSFVKNPVIGIYEFANETVSNFDNEILALRGLFRLYPGAEVSKLKFRISVIQTDDVDLDNFEYTPYKDNYVLNSVGDVTDTYNPLTGEYVQRVGILALNGNENWIGDHESNGSKRFYTYIQGIAIPIGNGTEANICCTHYEKNTANNVASNFQYGCGVSTGGNLSIRDNYTNTEDFKTYLQEQYNNGNPVTIYYELAEPLTTIINKTEVSANIPDTTMYIEDSNSLGSIKVLLQTKGR